MGKRIVEITKCVLALCLLAAVCSATVRSESAPAASADAAFAKPAVVEDSGILASSLDDVTGIWQFDLLEVSYVLEYRADGSYTLAVASDPPATAQTQTGRIGLEAGQFQIMPTRVYLNGHGPEACAGSYEIYALSEGIRLHKVAGCFTGPWDFTEGGRLVAAPAASTLQ